MIPSPPVADEPGPPLDNLGLRAYLKRAILSKLQPMMGTRATGSALVQATGVAVTLKKNSYAIPIIGSTTGSGASQSDHSRLLKVTADTVIDPVADPTGTLVPVFAQLGGSYYNADEVGGLVEDTGLEWSPAIDGVERVSTLSVGMSGGADLAVAGALKRILLFDRLGLGGVMLQRGPSLSAEIWRAKVGDFPAGILVLMGTRKQESGGRSRPIHRFLWRLLVITSSVGETEERGNDGDTALDWAGGLLCNTGSVDGQAFSIPRIELGPSNLLVADDAASMHHLDFDSFATIDKIDHRVFETWTETALSIVTDPSAEYPARADAITTVGPLSFEQE